MRTRLLLTIIPIAHLCFFLCSTAAQDTTCQSFLTDEPDCAPPCTGSPTRLAMTIGSNGSGYDHIVEQTFTCKSSNKSDSCNQTIQVPVAVNNPYCDCEGPGGPCCSPQSTQCVAGVWKCSGGATPCLGSPNCGDSAPICNCDGTWSCGTHNSPIIIDTQGVGFQLTNALSGVRFELDPTRGPEQIAWTALGSRNGWLTLPHDGKVETGKDLFGNFTPQPPSDHPNGFTALAVYDKPEHGGNGDGIIDWHDSVYQKLRIWIDENHDGKAQSEELHTLPSVGVLSISLAYTDSRFTDKWGNQFRYKGRINVAGNPFGDPVDRTIYDVFLDSTTALSVPFCEGRKTAFHLENVLK